MGVKICALASGSNGNCYYIGDHEDSILIDAGINCKQIINRMKQRGLDPGKIRAIFITHEHNDHVCGARVLSKKLDIPVYMTQGTYNSLYLTNKPEAVRFIDANQPLFFPPFVIYPVAKQHDAAEPTSFRVEIQETNIGVFTDIGEACDRVKKQLGLCEVLFLEANYDEKMLWSGAYPYHLKQRVASDVGHLSNAQAAQLLESYGGPTLKWVLLSHLSGDNNTPTMAFEAVKHLSERFNILLTSRKEAGEVIEIAN